ncbi:MAG TPA: S41 family peptidase [Deltaproteobacteria bacterium]|nr:S41 family peptidase [Deltaproteobacteria bacterium]
MKKTSLKVFISVVLCVVVIFLLLSYHNNNVAALDKSVYKDIRTFSEVFDMVDKNYVEEVDSSKLIQGAINGMLRSLDPHSSFMTPDLYKELEVETQGQFGGIGIEITILKDVLTVVSPIEGTPAFAAGVKPGDQIIRIDGKSTKDITIMEAVKQLRGPKGTKVIITIMRENMPVPEEIALTRAIIQIKSVRYKIYDENIAYIRIASFHERTSEDLRKALREVDKQLHPIKGLVLDLRNDPGGLLLQAIEVSDMFLKSGTIVSTRGRAKGMETKSVARDNKDEITCPIVVLVNEGTASAAEIVAGALQDNGRALVVGTPTFGKASVQTIIPMDDGSALKLTTGYYYTPNGRSIQAEGIKPDIIVDYVQPSKIAQKSQESSEDDFKEKEIKRQKKLLERNKSKDKEVMTTPDLALDNQLKTAVDILRSWNIMKVNTAS